jgi:hypothetical protein
MSPEQIPPNQGAQKPKEVKLPPHWQRIQSAIWLIGLAILFWQDWLWPGILVLVAISGLVQGGIQLYVSRQAEERQLAERRAEWLPSLCPGCGGPLSVATVNWTGPTTADCPYCKANLKPAA